MLAPGGTIAIIDTPFYHNSADGDRMMAERVVEFRQKYGLPEIFARKSSYMTYETLQQLTRSLPLTVRVHKVFPGFARKYQEVRARLVRRPIAEFPLVVLKKHE